MTTEPKIPEAARAVIGKETRYSPPFTISHEMVARYVESVGDPNPVFVSGEAARSAGYPSEVVPPGLVFDVLLSAPHRNGMDTIDVPLPTSVNLAGVEELEWVRPVAVGEPLRTKRKLRDVYAKQGRSGLLFFVVTEISFHDEAGNLVARKLETIIRR